MSNSARARAPMRLDFAGGWTDVPPFSAREGGVVINAAIQLFAHAQVTLGGSSIVLDSQDQDARAELPAVDRPSGDGRLKLLEAALRLCRPSGGCRLTTRSDAPPGSGLGSSGALDVALVAAFAHVMGKSPTPAAIAERGWRLESEEAGNPGGKQDQFAAALGGFHRFTFRDPNVDSERLSLDPEFVGALQTGMILCYTGTSRVSGATISRVIGGYERGDRAIIGALHGLKDTALAMDEALRNSDLAAVGRLLSANWCHQQALDRVMSTPAMARLEAAMRAAGALGGKAAGSGAGGCMFFLFPNGPAAERARVAALAEGADLLPARWSADGVAVASIEEC
ncbi:MAG TPA: hypothetical protein VFL95_10375 [Gemmatimonadales bacterium]|nr:hypothetical protein [Gemmatimonadales bacterium]